MTQEKLLPNQQVALKPCPFCGGKAEAGTHGDGWGKSFVRCRKCRATIEGDAPCAGVYYKKPAEKLWNKRA